MNATNRSIIQPTDAYLSGLSVSQLVAVYRANADTNDIACVVLQNRIICRLAELVGEPRACQLLSL